MRRRVTSLAMVMCAAGAYRLSLLGRGAFAFPDEGLYNNAVAAVLDLKSFHLRDVLSDIATCDSRPADAVVRMIPAALQVVTHAFGVPVTNPLAMLIPTGFNVIMSLITMYFFYRICLLLFDGDETIALTAVTVHALLVNTNLYIRHLLPMDSALAVTTFALWLTLARPTMRWLGISVGALAALTVTLYPGYYLLGGFVCVVAIVQQIPMNWKRAFAVAVGCAVGGGAVIVVFEVMSIIGGHPYIWLAVRFSGSIKQGAFDEGWVFLPDYLIRVERAIGVVLLGTLLLYSLRTWLEFRREGRIRPIQRVLLPAVAALVLQAIMSYHFQRFVIYGRLLHPWFIFLVIILADSIVWVRNRAARFRLCLAVVATAVLSVLPSAYDYYRLAYPMDILYALGIDTKKPHDVLAEMTVLYQYTSPAPLNVETNYPYVSNVRRTLVNFCIGTAPFRPLPDPPGSVPIYSGPHFLSFRAYGYEGLLPADRAEMASGRYRVRVLDVPSAR